MDALVEQISQRLEQLRQEIVNNIQAKGITASGRTQRSLTVEVREDGARLVAQAGRRAPIPTLEIGRPPGNVPGGFTMTKAGKVNVSNTFKGILMRWAEDKGIPDFGWAEATLLGRKIVTEGTARHTQPVDVYSSAVEKAAEDIKQMLFYGIRGAINETISNNFKQ